MFSKISTGFQKMKVAMSPAAKKSSEAGSAQKPVLSKNISTDRSAQTAPGGLTRSLGKLKTQLKHSLVARRKEAVDSEKLETSKKELQNLTDLIKKEYLGSEGSIQKTPEYQTLKEAIALTEQKIGSLRTPKEVEQQIEILQNAQTLAGKANATPQAPKSLSQELSDQIKTMKEQLEKATEAQKGLINDQIELLSRAQETLEAKPDPENIKLAKDILNLTRL